MSFNISGTIDRYTALPPVQPASGRAGGDLAPASLVATPVVGPPQDVVSFSPEARRLADEEAAKKEQEESTEGSEESASEKAVTENAVEQKLSDEEKRQLEDMKRREMEVMGHERAHQAAGGQYASAPSYSYQRGPDGGSYVADGEVSIDLSSVPGNPQATIQKAQQVRAAALAPSNPSGQDLRVAAEASEMAMDAHRQLVKEQREELRDQRQESTQEPADPAQQPLPEPEEPTSEPPQTEPAVAPPTVAPKNQSNPYADALAQTIAKPTDTYRSVSLTA